MLKKSSEKSQCIFLTRRSSSDLASVWLEIGQFWGNLAKNLTDSNLDVDK